MAVAPYERVGLCLLQASVRPEFAPPGYDVLLGRLWVRFQANRTLPSHDDFEADIGALLAMLRDAALPNGAQVGGERGEALVTAGAYIKAAHEAALSAGLAEG